MFWNQIQQIAHKEGHFCLNFWNYWPNSFSSSLVSMSPNFDTCSYFTKSICFQILSILSLGLDLSILCLGPEFLKLVPVWINIFTKSGSSSGFYLFLSHCFSMGDLGVQVSVRLFVRPSVCPSVCLSIRQHLPWVSCECNSSYSFLLIFLKLCRCFLHGVRMCMGFGYNCWIIFYHFFHFVNLVIFRPQCIGSGYLVSTTPHTILYQSFWNFAHVFSMVWRCAYGLDIIPACIFVTFSTLRTLSFSDLRFYENVVTVGTLWAQLLIQFYTDLFETLYMFLPWSGDVHKIWI